MDGIITDSGDDIAEGVLHALAVRGVLQKAESAGLERRVVVALAERLKPEEGLSVDQALTELEHAMEIALGVIARGAHGTIEGTKTILAEVGEITANANFDDAARVLDDALAETDRQEAEQQAVAHRNQVIFLEAAIEQHTLRRDVVGVVSRIERLAALDHSLDRLASLRAQYDKYLAEGEAKGVNFSLLVAAECARRLVAVAGQEELGAALVLLGNALRTLGQRENGVRRPLEAIKVYRNALKALTRDHVPLQWATIQNNLGDALCTLGQRERGTERIIEAVEACRQALKERTRKRVPLDWAITQNNLGNALSVLGERESGIDHLLEAVEAYREALKELAYSPRDRAMTQNNLGNVLTRLGERESGIDRLFEAVEAYREALKERTRERVPLDWAITQNNLGNALWTLGQRERSTERLIEAVETCREALKERTRERVPLQWATTQNNLGNALSALGQLESGTEHLFEAVEAYRKALEERTRERVPLDWAMTQNNLGTALSVIGQRERGTERLIEAVEAYRDALKEWTRERVPRSWAIIQYNLGIALSAIGKRESGIGRLHEAIEAYHETLKEFTRERVPSDWSNARNNLINTQTIINERLGFHSSAVPFSEQLTQRQNSDLVSKEIDYIEPMPAEVTTPDRGPKPPEAQDLSTATMDKATAYEIVAADKGLSSGAEVHEAIDYWAAKKEHTTRETKGRGQEEPRAPTPSKLKPSAPHLGEAGERPVPCKDFDQRLAEIEAAAAARIDPTLLRVTQRYKEERQTIYLPEAGFEATEHEEAQAASRFWANFDNLQTRVKNAGLVPLPRDPVVVEAGRLKSKFYRRNRDKDHPEPPTAMGKRQRRRPGLSR